MARHPAVERSRCHARDEAGSEGHEGCLHAGDDSTTTETTVPVTTGPTDPTSVRSSRPPTSRLSTLARVDVDVPGALRGTHSVDAPLTPSARPFPTRRSTCFACHVRSFPSGSFPGGFAPRARGSCRGGKSNPRHPTGTCLRPGGDERAATSLRSLLGSTENAGVPFAVGRRRVHGRSTRVRDPGVRVAQPNGPASPCHSSRASTARHPAQKRRFRFTS